MVESLKALKDFIFRDILYILGGVSVILSILYAYDKMDVVCKDLSIFIVLYIVGISYVLGWLIQTTFSVFHIVTTSQNYRPKRWLIKLLFICFMRQNKFKKLNSSTKTNILAILMRMHQQ